ncbi:PREDICTED: von Willebrand factor A domain-containing protein 5B2-like, partial [Leptosomus discolor]
MPGLYALSSWEALPLKSSRVKACANGYSLSITTQLVYTNPYEEPVEGIFIYPLEESEVVAGFEAAVGSRRVTFQVQNRHRVQDCCLQCGPSPGRPHRCASGHLVLDEDAERSTFIIVTGTLCPAESLAVTLSTAQELATLPDGALHLLLPPVLMPRVPAVPESEPASLCDDRLALCPTSCFGGPGARTQPSPVVPVESVDIFRGQPYNPFPYEFAFELLVKGPCLLAGLESPSHALRADADPWASSATTTCVTLAEPHRYDRDLEIILYPCEPHHPHLVMEDGTMTYPEYEAHIRSRRDYIRIARKDSSGERQVAFVQKRFHKDIFPNPVLMLNFCPAVEDVPGDLQSVTREVLFLVDRSSTMSGPDLDKVKEALLVALKSLPSGTLLNLDRFLFLFTNVAAGNAGRILRLVRRQASTVRCFSFGMGPRACRWLLKGMAKVSRGRCILYSISRFRDRRPLGREGARRGSRGSAFPSQEEVPSPGESRQPPRSTPGSRDASLELSAGGTETSERSADPISGGDIWKRIYQPSYIQEQYVLTHCSVSTDRSRGLLSHSSTSSESTGSRDVAPEGGSSAPGADATSQQGQKSLSLCESSTKSAPLPSAPAGTKWHGLGNGLPPHNSTAGALCCRNVKHNLLSPTHLDWDMLVEPSYLFSASPAPEQGEPSLGDASPPLRCQVVIH